ncbi:DYH17 protein, partial [Spelaeornis formosus]|nr:DYH17 protein [Elachura formosa]
VMFEPLKDTVALLKTYGDKMPEEIHLQLQKLPEQWDNNKKLCLRVVENVAPLRAAEAAIIHDKCQ